MKCTNVLVLFLAGSICVAGVAASSAVVTSTTTPAPVVVASDKLTTAEWELISKAVPAEVLAKLNAMKPAEQAQLIAAVAATHPSLWERVKQGWTKSTSAVKETTVGKAVVATGTGVATKAATAEKKLASVFDTVVQAPATVAGYIAKNDHTKSAFVILTAFVVSIYLYRWYCNNQQETKNVQAKGLTCRLAKECRA